MHDPNEIKINPSLDTHGLSEHEYMERISAWRDTVMGRTDADHLSAALRISHEAFDNFIQNLQVPQQPMFIGTPREPSILDILTHAPIEMPEHRVTWHQRVDAPDNIDSNINEI